MSTHPRLPCSLLRPYETHSEKSGNFSINASSLARSSGEATGNENCAAKIPFPILRWRDSATQQLGILADFRLSLVPLHVRSNDEWRDVLAETNNSASSDSHAPGGWLRGVFLAMRQTARPPAEWWLSMPKAPSRDDDSLIRQILRPFMIPDAKGFAGQHDSGMLNLRTTKRTKPRRCPLRHPAVSSSPSLDIVSTNLLPSLCPESIRTFENRNSRKSCPQQTL